MEYEGMSLGPVTLSLGVASFPHHGDREEEVLRAADEALYRAKALGRDQVVLAETTITQKSHPSTPVSS
jgi:diguanylate cyclase (GGDEF)-like protein